jgi:hypothetical protein
MRKIGRPEAIVIDRLLSYSGALKEIATDTRQEVDRWVKKR